MKEYLKKVECLRRRIQRKTNEIYLLHQQAEGMNAYALTYKGCQKSAAVV